MGLRLFVQHRPPLENGWLVSSDVQRHGMGDVPRHFKAELRPESNREDKLDGSTTDD